MKKVSALTLSFISAIVLLSCSSTDVGRKFTPVETGFMLDSGKSIAVISGHNDDNDIQLAEMITEKLTATGKFKVLTQSEITKKMPQYPLNYNVIDFVISGEDDRNYSPYLNNSSKERIDALQKQVKADYILVVWIEGMNEFQSRNATSRHMFVKSRFITYPAGNVSAYSNRWNKDNGCCLFGISDWDDVFNIQSSDLVKEMIKNTK